MAPSMRGRSWLRFRRMPVRARRCWRTLSSFAGSRSEAVRRVSLNSWKKMSRLSGKNCSGESGSLSHSQAKNSWLLRMSFCSGWQKRSSGSALQRRSSLSGWQKWCFLSGWQTVNHFRNFSGPLRMTKNRHGMMRMNCVSLSRKSSSAGSSSSERRKPYLKNSAKMKMLKNFWLLCFWRCRKNSWSGHRVPYLRTSLLSRRWKLLII